MPEDVVLRFEDMIDAKCFTSEWIAQKAEEYHYSDRNLIEKVIRALSLLDMLAASGCPFHFKGGSCLMLLLAGDRHRLSIDIDIMCPPGTDIEAYLTDYTKSGFLEYKLIERRQTMANVPKTHSKFFYQVSFKNDSDERSFILLDVLYEDCHYIETKTIPIVGDFIETVGEPLMVKVPSVNDILGDKLTAFAPDTTGIPYFKNGDLKTLEIIKQLYDIGRLFEHADNLSVTTDAFRKIAVVELGYRGMSTDLSPIFEDIRQTALNIATRGKVDQDKFTLLQSGIKSISPFIFKGKYHIEDAIADSAKAAYLATLIEMGATTLAKYTGDLAALSSMNIGKCLNPKLNKLKLGNPEAFFYWAKVDELLETE